MRENSLYPKIIAGLKDSGCAAWRVADSHLIKQPFDICGVNGDGTAVAIEVKVKRDGSIDDLTPCWKLYSIHQHAWLKEYAKKDAYSFALEYDIRSKTMWVYVLDIDRNLPKGIDSDLRVRQRFSLTLRDDKFEGWHQLETTFRIAT